MVIKDLVKRPILRALNAYLKWKREQKWSKQALQWRKTISFKETESISDTSKYLILAPHSDDEWIGCSQIISRCKNVVILNMDMPGGDSLEMHKDRYLEMHTLSKEYNKELLTIGTNKTQSLKDYICTIRPDFICLPHFFDWHPEHIQVMEYLRQALKMCEYKGKIIMYQVSLPLHPDFVNCIAPLDIKTFKQKWVTFKEVYRTQTFISYPRFMANERINGALADSYAAEVYSVNESRKWLHDFEFMLLSNEERNKVKLNLSDISIIRYMVENFFIIRNL